MDLFYFVLGMPHHSQTWVHYLQRMYLNLGKNFFDEMKGCSNVTFKRKIILKRLIEN